MTAQEYLKSHGITQTFAKSQGVTWTEHELHIPIKDENGKQLFIKSRNLKFEEGGDSPKYKNSAGSHAALFNLHAVKELPSLLLTEGEIDCMKAMQDGIPAVASTSGAGTFPSEWAEIFKDKKVYIVYDNDKAGIKGTRNVLDNVPHAKVVTLPEGIKGLCDFRQLHSKKDLISLMRTAKTKLEWEALNLPEDFATITGTELLSMEFKQEPWLIDNILYNEGFCFLYGAEGTGKSYLALDMALAVAQGINWLEEFTVSKPTPVLILDKENPLSMLSKRLRGLKGTGDNVHFLKYPEKFMLSDGKGNLSEFALALSTIVAEKKIGLIVVDSFVDLMVGNESSSEDTQGFFNALRQLFPQVAFLVLHHENKPSQGLYRNDSQRLRGSSNINAQTFTMFRLEQVAKSKTEMTLKQTKARDALKLDKFMVQMIVGTVGNTEETVVTGFKYMGEVEEQDETKTAEIQNTIGDMIIDKGNVPQKDILEMAKGLGASTKTARRALKDLVESGEINEYRNGREKWYTRGMFGGGKNNNEDEGVDDYSVFDGGLPNV